MTAMLWPVDFNIICLHKDSTMAEVELNYGDAF